ncbi:hypothetical protein [uncultured Desulfobulbus sp.]|uniref:hypothetical protein n=1 Tax=uncultured Desulfobulbus sp. TaxID=239745 RepID=UPI0029C75941|nr:hypothetical protein [uncultured Desulfobulbus sp.]
MYRVIRYAIIAFSIFAAAVTGHCSIVDDFNDGAMNTTLWTTFIDGIGPSATEVPGCVVVTIPADAHEADDPHSFGGGFKSAKCLRGDFDIQIDYTLTEWPSGSGVRVGMGLFPAHTGSLANVQRSSFGQVESGPIEAYATDYGGIGGGGVPTNHISGSLRFARVGNMLTAGVLVDSEWVEIYSAEFSTDDYYFAFTAWSHNYAFSHEPVEVEFDNFLMRYGELVDPSTPPLNASIQKSSFTPKVVRAYAGKKPSFRSANVIVMPHGRSFIRLQKISPANVAPNVGPYARVMINLPSVKSGIKSSSFSMRK